MTTTPAIYNDGGDRLLVSVLIAASLHALLILGISFAPSEPENQGKLPTLDITLVTPRDTPAPEQADYLAQVSQDGGGNTSEKVRPQLEQAAQPSASTPPPAKAAGEARPLTNAVARRKVQMAEDPKPNAPASAAELIDPFGRSGTPPKRSEVFWVRHPEVSTEVAEKITARHFHARDVPTVLC